MVFYPLINNCGLKSTNAFSDGYTINIQWYQAYSSVTTNRIAYNIYYSTTKENVFSEGVKYISIDDSLEANIINLDPGQLYFFSVRPIEYNPNVYNLNILPIAYDNLRVLPTSLLRENINSTVTTIPLLDVYGFPTSGIARIGAEVISYNSIDQILNNLTSVTRGFSGSRARIHNIDGYDGYYYQDPIVTYFINGEDLQYDRIFECQCRFERTDYQRTNEDGYHQVLADLLTSDLSQSDEYNVDFPAYDYSGYHRTDPVQLLTGQCVGSYIGGEQGCIDKYGNVNIVRGFNLQDFNNQRQELGLSVTGRVATLIQRSRTGITCNCYQPSSEYADDRCPRCLGSKYVHGFEQYFNPRRSDGRIKVRLGPSDEDVKMTEAGLESEVIVDIWTLTVPTIKDRDILVLYQMDEQTEEYRYEVLSVNRNNTLLNFQGGQKLRAQRIRKTDSLYQVQIFKDSSLYPSTLTTSVGYTTSIVPHTHTIVVSEKITALTQINQVTSVSQGHSHPVIAGQVLDSVGHRHEIVL